MSSPPTSFKLNASVGLEDTRNNPPVEDYDDASCFPELHLANYVQNLHHNVPQYNFSESIYHGISRGPLSDRMRIDLCSSLAMLMDTGTGPETATAVSISICGGTGTQGYQLPREELAREISSKNMKCDTGLCHVRVKVYVAQGRDEVPKVDLQNLHKVLVEVGFFHEFFDAPQVSQESQDKEIMRDILPAIVRLSEQKIMLILNQLPLLDRAYAEMIHKCHPENYTIPTTVQAKYKSIHDLASEAMRPGCNAEKRHYILGHIIRHSYELRSSIDNEIGVLDAMERNWAGIIRFQLKTGVLPTTTEVIPAKYRGETFGGWRSQDPERDLEMDENDNLSSHSEGTEPENPSCDYDKYSLPQKLVKQYVAHNGIYSRLCPRFRDGQPLNPLTYWLGALGKYFVAAKILLHSPVFYRVASRPRNSKVDILVRGVPYNLFARYSQTASGRPDVPRTFDQFARYQIDTGVAPKIGYGSSNVRNSFEMHWQDAVKNQHLFVHPEMKLILYNAIEWRFNRQLVYIRREDTELTGEKVIRDLDSLDRCKHYRVIGTSRDICFSCRAFIKGWNGVNDKQQVLPDGRKRTPQCHCTNMVLGYRCNYCEDFDEEPLRTHLRFFVGFAGDPNIQTQRNHFFDPSWLAPRIMMPIGFEEGNHQFWHQLEVFLETLNHRNQVCVRIELQKLLGEGRIQELLECAAENGFGNEEGSEFDPLTHKVNQVTDVFLVPHRALQNQGPKAMVPAHEVPAESQTRVQRPVNLVAQNCPLIEVAEQVQFVNTIPTEAQEHYSADELYQYPRRGFSDPIPHSYHSAPLHHEESFYPQTSATPARVSDSGSSSTAVVREYLDTRPFSSDNSTPMPSGRSFYPQPSATPARVSDSGLSSTAVDRRYLDTRSFSTGNMPRERSFYPQPSATPATSRVSVDREYLDTRPLSTDNSTPMPSGRSFYPQTSATPARVSDSGSSSTAVDREYLYTRPLSIGNSDPMPRGRSFYPQPLATPARVSDSTLSSTAVDREYLDSRPFSKDNSDPMPRGRSFYPQSSATPARVSDSGSSSTAVDREYLDTRPFSTGNSDPMPRGRSFYPQLLATPARVSAVDREYLDTGPLSTDPMPRGRTFYPQPPATPARESNKKKRRTTPATVSDLGLSSTAVGRGYLDTRSFSTSNSDPLPRGRSSFFQPSATPARVSAVDGERLDTRPLSINAIPMPSGRSFYPQLSTSPARVSDLGLYSTAVDREYLDTRPLSTGHYNFIAIPGGGSARVPAAPSSIGESGSYPPQHSYPMNPAPASFAPRGNGARRYQHSYPQTVHAFAPPSYPGHFTHHDDPSGFPKQGTRRPSNQEDRNLPYYSGRQ